MPTALLLALVALQAAPDPHRQFDFWIGEWSVQNRHMQADGSWRDGDVTRARITPVCGGRAILEEWAGPFQGGFMNGFSLRAYDPARTDWDLLLYWTTDGNGAFGKLRGSFRHGRGEFFPTLEPGQRNSTRYTFSDGLPASCRWDSARTSDGGASWSTDWIMEFSRTRAAAQVTQDRLFSEDWNVRPVSGHEAARALDWTVGRWEGSWTELASGAEGEARLRSRILNGDTLIVDLLETRAPGAEDWDERMTVRAFVSSQNRWEAWRVHGADTVLRRMVGSADGEGLLFRVEPRGTSRFAHEALIRGADGALVIEEEAWPTGGPGFSATSEAEAARVIELRRVE
jgi:hypothetical protein